MGANSVPLARADPLWGQDWAGRECFEVFEAESCELNRSKGDIGEGNEAVIGKALFDFLQGTRRDTNRQQGVMQVIPGIVVCGGYR